MATDTNEINTYFGRCRCCLNYGYLKNMWEEHYWEGKKEIYVEMLVQCFALAWEPSEESMKHDQICEACVTRLRDADNFKKTVLDSQVELLAQIDEEPETQVKIEPLDVSFEYNEAFESEDTADTKIYTGDDDDDDPDYNVSLEDEDTNDVEEYEDVEYLEDEDNKNDIVQQQVSQTQQKESASSKGLQNWTRKSPKYRRYTNEDMQSCLDDISNKRLTRIEASAKYGISLKTLANKLNDKDYKPQLTRRQKGGAPPMGPTKWPKKLPKSERYKTYRQYTEEDFRACMEDIKCERLTSKEAADKYNVPIKTISNKLREEARDNLNGSTTMQKDKPENNKILTRVKPTIFRAKLLQTKEIIDFIAKKKINDITTANDDTKDKVDVTDLISNIKTEKVEISGSVDVKQVRSKYKAIVNAKFKNECNEPENSDASEMYKHKNNIRHILECSNATMIKGFWGNGYSCCFCRIQKENPLDLKEHNLEIHVNVGKDAIKGKYVSDLVIRLDVTNLKCNICDKTIDSLDTLIEHLTVEHNKTIYNDIKSHIIPFKFESDILQCVKCNKEFKYFKLLSEHMSEHYSNYKCHVCERSFINKQSLQTHSYRHKSGVFQCSHCPKVFDTRPKKSVHERVTHTLSNKTRKCSYCDERFSTKDLVQSHETKVHGVKIAQYNCTACNKSYNSHSSLVTHRKRYHLMLRPHKCTFCDMAFYSRIELRSHTVTHTKSRDFKCDECNKSFGTRCSLNQHVRGHMNEKKFKCDNCERAFVHRTAFKVHMRNVQRPSTKSCRLKQPRKKLKTRGVEFNKIKANVRNVLENSNATPFQGHWNTGYGCSYCTHMDPSPAELKSHTLSNHASEEYRVTSYMDMIIKLDITGLQCSLCCEDFAYLDKFMDHLEYIHDIEIHTDITEHIVPYKFDKDELSCALCAKPFEYFKYLTEHMVDHYRNYECDLCGRGFINARGLKAHMERHQLGVFQCSYCTKNFNTKSKVKAHERILHIRMSKTRKCNYCDERFMDEVRQTNHEVSVHGTPMPSYQCKACDKTYTSVTALKAHTKHFHLMLQLHKCSYCGKGFSFMNKLKSHEALHTGVMNFQCSICNSRYISRKSLVKHLKIHTDDERYKCEVCGQEFVEKSSLSMHLKSHMNIE